MMEPSKLLDTLKSIATYWHILFVLTTLLLVAHFFAPSCILVSLGLDIFIDEYIPWISLLWIVSIIFGLFHFLERYRKGRNNQQEFQSEAEQARKTLKKLCEVILHDYRSQKSKAQELGGASFPLSWAPNVLRKWEHRADEVKELSEAINELPPVEFLKYSVKGDDNTIHTKFLLRDPYRNRGGDSRIGMRDVNVLEFRLSAVPKDRSKMGMLTMDEVEATSLDIHFERLMEQWIMFLDTEGGL